MWGSKGESWRKVQDVYSVFLPLQRLTAQKLCRRIHGLAACSKICHGASFTKRTVATGSVGPDGL